MRRGMVLLLGLALVAAACAGANSRPTLTPARMTELWEAPADLAQRNLLFGSGGAARAPDPNGRYELLEADNTGFSPGYDVKDESGQEWGVKLGPEARTEVVVSRLLWAAGYRQPYIYYLPTWRLADKDGVKAQSQARFRLKTAGIKDVGTWSWRENPFADTQQLAGLFVMMVIVNNWDLKEAQNGIYQVESEDQDPRQWYVVKDLGASLGASNWFFPGTRDDLKGFEQEGFIAGVEGNRVRFHFKGAWREPHLLANVSPDDVRWACGLLARLSPEQWMDAFRAGGYEPAEAERYIKRLKQKVAEGLSLSL